MDQIMAMESNDVPEQVRFDWLQICDWPLLNTPVDWPGLYYCQTRPTSVA